MNTVTHEDQRGHNSAPPTQSADFSMPTVAPYPEIPASLSRGTALALPLQWNGRPGNRRRIDCAGRPTVEQRRGRFRNTEDLDHAPSDTPALLYDSRNPMWLRDSPPTTLSAYLFSLRPAADRVCQPAIEWNSHSKEGRTSLDYQAAPIDSKATERSRCVRRTFRLRTYQLRTHASTVATK
jgi:hypothetical protein